MSTRNHSERVSTANSECRTDSPCQRFIDREGHSIGYRISGTGRRTVILDPGLHQGTSTWATVTRELDTFANMVTLDRSCLLNKAPDDVAIEPARVAGQIRQLLDCGRLSEPIILVGWSTGAIYANAFATAYPGDTAGLVLVDPIPECLVRDLAHENQDIPADESSPASPLLDDVRWFIKLLGNRVTALKEPDFAASVPRTLISRGDHATQRDRFTARCSKRQQEALRGGAFTREIIAGRAGSNIPVSRPDVIVDAILDLIDHTS